MDAAEDVAGDRGPEQREPEPERGSGARRGVRSAQTLRPEQRHDGNDQGGESNHAAALSRRRVSRSSAATVTTTNGSASATCGAKRAASMASATTRAPIAGRLR